MDNSSVRALNRAEINNHYALHLPSGEKFMIIEKNNELNIICRNAGFKLYWTDGNDNNIVINPISIDSLTTKLNIALAGFNSDNITVGILEYFCRKFLGPSIRQVRS
jgi:hypothetical protein